MTSEQIFDLRQEYIATKQQIKRFERLKRLEVVEKENKELSEIFLNSGKDK